MQVIGNGTITNPYECNESFKVNLNCQIPSEGDSSSITLEVSSLYFYKESDSDGWFTSFSVNLINHKGDFPINISGLYQYSFL